MIVSTTTTEDIMTVSWNPDPEQADQIDREIRERNEAWNDDFLSREDRKFWRRA
jgi:hypothetical protein